VRPEVALARPGDGAGNVRTDVTVMARVKSSSRIDPATVNARSVFLVRTADQVRVDAAVSLDSRGARIILHPAHPLEPATDFTLYVGDAVRDSLESKMVPFASAFRTTGAGDPSIAFHQVALPAAQGAGFTCVVMGPDQKLYAGTDDGRIMRFAIRADGTLQPPQVITSLYSASGPRVLSGFCFDPRSDADHLIVYAANGYPGFKNVPDWTGRITRMSGPNLEQVQDVVVGLPRSVRDHLTFQPVFGPDGAIYFAQGSNSASGAADRAWGDRPERLLTASILRLELGKLPQTLPLDVRTPDGGGMYDPSAPAAALTIYAGGVRVAYDLVWTSAGMLLAPANGSSAGGNTPAGAGAQGIVNVALAEDDWLFHIMPGAYYGHPNPLQHHYVLNGGNPTADFDFAETVDYPVGTQPDKNWQRAIFSFGKHVSANGALEYRGGAFGGKLNGWILVCRYNVGADLIAVHVDRSGKADGVREGIAGCGDLNNPLDLCEDLRSGAIYVSEYGAQRLTLLRPASSGYASVRE
jgi:glucose/arabinose dehydrogenase